MSPEELSIRHDLLQGACRICGCTQATACYTPEHGPCWWIEPDLCSHCGEPAIVAWQLSTALAMGDEALVIRLQPRALAALQRAAVVPASAFEPVP